VRCDRLLVCFLTVPEESTLARAHLEEPEILAILRSRRMMRLAPRDLQGLIAVASPENATDRDLGWRVGEPPRFATLQRAPERDDGSRDASKSPFGAPTRGDGDRSMLARAEKRAVILEKKDDAAMLPRRFQLLLEARLQGDDRLRRFRCSRRLGRDLGTLPFRYRRDLHRREKDAQANE